MKAVKVDKIGLCLQVAAKVCGYVCSSQAAWQRLTHAVMLLK